MNNFSLSNTLSRRSLLRAALIVPFAVPFANSVARANSSRILVADAFTLPPLPYKFNELEPHIDAETMELHHDKHHATYVKNLNDAIAKAPELAGKSADDLIKMLDTVPEAIRMTVRNNAGGHVNHSMFWTLMKPHGGGEPTGAIADAIKSTFTSFDMFKTAFNEAGTKRFGSGWVWLVKNKAGKLEIMTTPNQDNPTMAEYGSYPIFGNDLWEHAYYLKYRNRRIEYLTAWWNTVNWDEINKRFAAAPALTAAVDVGGVWTLTGDAQGTPVNATVTFKQDSTKLTGTTKSEAGEAALMGDVSGSKVTWTINIKYQGNDLTVVFAGNVGADGTMTGTLDATVATGTFTAKKQ